MQSYSNQLYKQIPSLRFFIPICFGIVLQFHLKIAFILLAITIVSSLSFLIFFNFLKVKLRFRFNWIKGFFFNILFIAIGALLSFGKQVQHSPSWVGNFLQDKEPTIVTLKEDLVSKEKSYKVLATVELVYAKKQWQNVEGDVLLYFKKDSSTPNLKFGDQLIIKNNLVKIINSGNPGGFDYARYCSFQHISYQAFLRNSDYVTLPTKKYDAFTKWLLSCRNEILSILKKNIKNKNEQSIAEALLIGYREELDRDLVRAFSNTGVVHIIAISGLHLGMIYGLILVLFKPLKKYKWSNVIKLITVIVVLWLFSFIAGLPPSLLRSAIMFTCIALGDVISKKSNIYNGLVVSALIILIINPFSLWDVGFQLSYTAVLSIVIFSGAIKKAFFFKNKLLAAFWSLNAITLSAQILTLPIVLYHFHQFPNLFLFTNLFAVPFSGLILYTEIVLVLFGWFTTFANFLGIIIEKLIFILNQFVLQVNILPFATWESIQISIPQAMLLYAFLIALSFWILTKKNEYRLITFIFLGTIIVFRSIDFIEKHQQQKIIVYNVPSHTAIDIVDGRKFNYIGDEELMKDGFLRNFHIKPSRVLHRINFADSIQQIVIRENVILSNKKKILHLNKYSKSIPFHSKWDVIVFSKNPKVSITKLSRFTSSNKYVFDGSNSLWKINQWKRECDSLHLQYHICSLEGAFEMNL
jgi:competence protein ComEC